jgi:hypothetical protein
MAETAYYIYASEHGSGVSQMDGEKLMLYQYIRKARM